VSNFDNFAETVNESYLRCAAHYSGDETVKCISNDLFKQVNFKNNELVELTSYRDEISGGLRNYTCSDPTSVTSTPIRSATEKFVGRTVTVDTLLERDSAKIWVSRRGQRRRICSLACSIG
jgi:hypothetical protein